MLRIRLIKTAGNIFRIAVGAILAYFGVLAIMEPEMQANLWVRAEFQEIILRILPLEIFMRILGLTQVATAVVLFSGKFLKIGLSVTVFLLIGIIVNLGFNEIAYRDAVILTGVIYLLAQEF